jgi:hypothetical protein
MNRRIIPLNLPAGLEREIAGNPVTSRLESTPANCRPGLDVDIRNLDRRFFPGLVFDFAEFDKSDPLAKRRGAQLVHVDLDDPDLPKADKVLGEQLSSLKDMLGRVPILLESLEAGGHSISLRDSSGFPLDWGQAWRVVRSIEPGPVIITLSRFEENERVFLMTLAGRRRIYQKKTGELSEIYKPGELTQSLCSPWQHDFRECACSYWASNHPDIVLAAHPADTVELDDTRREDDEAEDPVIWMRWEVDKPVPPRPTGDGSRALEMDQYEINQRWRELAFVLQGREQPAPWGPVPVPEAPPLPAEMMLERLEKLAGVEQALALEYLYARYTVRFYENLESAERRHATFIGHELMNVAISEMMHLRWANQLLTRLQQIQGKSPRAALRVSTNVPKGLLDADADHYLVESRPTAERPIDEAIADFVAAEAPSGTLEGQYAQILSRLKTGWPKDGEVRPDLIGLVERIIADGVGHYSRFREIQALLLPPAGHQLVKCLKNVEDGSPDYLRAEELYREVINTLRVSYENIGPGTAHDVVASRKAMDDLNTLAKELASREPGLAIPFLRIGYRVAGSIS